MSGNDTLAKALADVRQRRIELQTEYDRLSGELSKLRLAEKSLAAIVEGASLDDAADQGEEDPDGGPPRPRVGKRGSRGPRANSAKGRLRQLLLNTGAQGLSHAEIASRLPDVAPATLNAYLSTMSTSGEILRHGDFYRIEADADDPAEGGEEDGGDED